MCYKDLDAQSNQVAHYLQTTHSIRGKSDHVIGLCMERTEMLYIALLGIHKAGAAYTYISFNFPKKNIEHILENSDPQVQIFKIILLYDSA